MDALFAAGEATAVEVRRRMPDPPTDTAVRTMLRILEDKGLVEHRSAGRRYVYRPIRSPRAEGRSAMKRVVRVFFGGSLTDALAAHFSDPATRIDEAELRRLHDLIDQTAPPPARKPRKGNP